MNYDKSLLAPTMAASLKEVFESASLSTEAVEECVRRTMGTAIEIREPQTGRLVTLNALDQESPVLVHYKPHIAAQILISLVAGIAGASNPLTLSLAILACVLALRDMREQASEDEALLFSIVFESTNHQLKRDYAKREFLRACKTRGTTGDFEIALHGLVNCGCLKILGTEISISDPIVIRRKSLS